MSQFQLTYPTHTIQVTEFSGLFAKVYASVLSRPGFCPVSETSVEVLKSPPVSLPGKIVVSYVDAVPDSIRRHLYAMDQEPDFAGSAAIDEAIAEVKRFAAQTIGGLDDLDMANMRIARLEEGDSTKFALTHQVDNAARFVVYHSGSAFANAMVVQPAVRIALRTAAGEPCLDIKVSFGCVLVDVLCATICSEQKRSHDDLCRRVLARGHDLSPVVLEEIEWESLRVAFPIAKELVVTGWEKAERQRAAKRGGGGVFDVLVDAFNWLRSLSLE